MPKVAKLYKPIICQYQYCTDETPFHPSYHRNIYHDACAKIVKNLASRDRKRLVRKSVKGYEKGYREDVEDTRWPVPEPITPSNNELHRLMIHVMAVSLYKETEAA